MDLKDIPKKIELPYSTCCNAPVKKGLTGLVCTFCKKKNARVYFPFSK